MLSIARSLDHKQMAKGKSSFSFSHDRKYILKRLKEKEFRMFLDVAPNYFKHVNLSIFHNLPSRLVKVLGAYRVTVKNLNTGSRRCEWVLMSENLGYNLDTQYADYDLKGTINERRKSTATSNKTKMDLDFIEDFESVPLCLYEDEKLRNFDYALNNDSYFL